MPPNLVPRLLLRYMADRQVVPVIGQSLSLVPTESGLKTVSQVLAGRLAEQLCIPTDSLPPKFTLNDVICAYPMFHSVPSSIYAELRDVFERADFPIPEPLTKLARIPAFQLFVTTSFDGLMKRALEQERGPISSFTYFPKSKVDLEPNSLQKNPIVLFELFGHVSSALDEYTVSEDDLLEFARALQTDPQRPAQLLAAMGRSHLLLLGTGFPDWLARFFLRTIKDNRIRSQRGRQEFIVDEAALSDPKLLEFIKYFSRETTVIPTSDVRAFVDALHAQWFEAYPEGEADTANTAAAHQATPHDDQAASVFLSYASEDYPAVQNVKAALDQQGWNVWLDKAGGLEAGDDYDRKIRLQIQSSAVFIPIVSENTEKTPIGQGRYFRREWNWAMERLPDFTGMNWEFIVPLRLDAIDIQTAQIPEAFRARHWSAPAIEGRLPDAFLDMMKQKLRQLRKR